jgi:hypothetical protein
LILKVDHRSKERFFRYAGMEGRIMDGEFFDNGIFVELSREWNIEKTVMKPKIALPE